MYKLLMARGATMTLLAALMLGGCMQATLAPTPEARTLGSAETKVGAAFR